MEMEKELQQMLNFRFGFGTWNELKDMQRKIRAQRQKEVYAAAERRQAIINGVAVTLLTAAAVFTLGGMIYLIGVGRGDW